MFAQICDAADKMESVGEFQIADEGLQLVEVVRLQNITGYAERDVGKLRDDGSSGPDKDVVTFHAADIAYCCDDGVAFGFSGSGGDIPVGEVEAVVDRLYASRIDAIDLYALATDLLGDG